MLKIRTSVALVVWMTFYHILYTFFLSIILGNAIQQLLVFYLGRKFADSMKKLATNKMLAVIKAVFHESNFPWHVRDGKRSGTWINFRNSRYYAENS